MLRYARPRPRVAIPRVEDGFEGFEVVNVRYSPRDVRPRAWTVMNHGRLTWSDIVMSFL